MKLEKINEVVTDPILLERGYRVEDDYLFTAIRQPANVFDAIIMNNPLLARRYGGNKVASSRSLEEHIRLINEFELDKAYVIAENIAFLTQCPTLKHLDINPAIASGDAFDFTPLYRCNEIKSLICATAHGKYFKNKSMIDYSKIKGLEALWVRATQDMSFSCIDTLKTLSVWENAASRVDDLFCSEELDSLELNSCKLRTLDGIEKASKLQCLYLSYNTILQDISELEKVKGTLRALKIQNCAKIKDFSVLSHLSNLEYLYLAGSNKISDINFIKQLPNLKTLVLNMEVENGDLIPCMTLSYVHCGKMSKKYNVKKNELPKGDFYRGNENIEMWRRIQ